MFEKHITANGVMNDIAHSRLHLRSSDCKSKRLRPEQQANANLIVPPIDSHAL
jgi:hypothetical protein